jgi:hypothetical protein
LNIATRLRVDVGDKVMIGGFIITGNTPKAVVLRGLGPSLVNSGLPAALLLSDPLIELHGSGGLITSNDNWQDSPQKDQIKGTAFQPSDDRESVILTTLPPAAYTVVLKGAHGETGIGVVEVYDNNSAVDSQLANISTRGFVQTGDNVIIGGFTLGGPNNPTNIAVRALGPSLSAFCLSNLLADPTLELHNANGTIMISNDDWQDDPASAAQLTAHGLGLPNPKEAGLFVTLAPPTQFTSIVRGKNGGTGTALIEIYDVGTGPFELYNLGLGMDMPAPPCSNPTPTATATPTVAPSATATPTATATVTPTSQSCTEDFDGVTPPALPAGWVATNAAGPEPSWITSSALSDTPPNDVVVKAPSEISDKRLDSPAIAISSASAQLRFRSNFSLQQSFDGGVLEVSINGSGFTDILATGGSFVTGGYTDMISAGAASPIAGRMAWSGNSGGYIDSVVNLGPNVIGQTIKLRFRLGTDQATGGGGWRIDTISIPGATCP